MLKSKLDSSDATAEANRVMLETFEPQPEDQRTDVKSGMRLLPTGHIDIESVFRPNR